MCLFTRSNEVHDSGNDKEVYGQRSVSLRAVPKLPLVCYLRYVTSNTNIRSNNPGILASPSTSKMRGEYVLRSMVSCERAKSYI